MNMKPTYPLKFHPILKERIWGGSKLHSLLNKKQADFPVGESWEISAIPGSVSIVENGKLKGKNLQELIEDYLDLLLGTEVFKKYGTNFPLLIKFIDAQNDLSIQLHPNDELAQKRHNSFGKEELWYILEAEKNSQLLFGFSKKLNKKSLMELLSKNNLKDFLHSEHIEAGDVFHIPAGRVHGIGKGIVLAEIQQSSDHTYRLYDWNRVDENGNSRELHTELAMDAIDFDIPTTFKTVYKELKNTENSLNKNEYFTTNLLDLTKQYIFSNPHMNRFSIYIVIEGNGEISTEIDSIKIDKGECILMPACLKEYKIQPDSAGIKLLQVFPK